MPSKPADVVEQKVTQNKVQDDPEVPDIMEKILLEHLLLQRSKRDVGAFDKHAQEEKDESLHILEEKNRCSVIGTLVDPPFTTLLKPTPVDQGGFQQRLLAPADATQLSE